MTDNQPARVRYAPSPTGYFHVGGARTALYDYLLARQTGGAFILRVEDTDQKRFNPEAVADLLAGLRFLGLEWDEGVEAGGSYGPYTQTGRLDIYRKYTKQLLDDGYAYRCFCSSERLAAVNDARQKAGQNPGYDRHCRRLAPPETEARAAAGESFTVRLKVPPAGSITVHDAIRGAVTVKNSQLNDAVLIKSNGIPTYHFAVVVDDHLMEITHVMRGEEWLSSYPLHAHLYNFLGWEPPVFAHLPVILNPAGKGKMSKRETRAPDGSLYPVFVHTFKEMGYLPEAMFNYLALVGWSYDDKTEFMTREEIIGRFSLKRVNASPAAWNYDKLNHFNGIYIRRLSVEALTDRLLPFVRRAGIQADRDTLLKITPLIQERLTLLSEAAEKIDFFFGDDLPPFDLALLTPKKLTPADVPPILQKARAVLARIEFNHDALAAGLKQAAADMGLKAGQFFQPVRVATCGKKVAPPLYGTLAVLGKETVLRRIDQTLARLSE